jgi:phosphoglycolate phosphatase-like HAD superfamily hydrolase
MTKLSTPDAMVFDIDGTLIDLADLIPTVR